MAVYGSGRWPALTSFHAENLRTALLGRNREMIEDSRRAVESLGARGGPTELDSERLELLLAVSDSLAGAGSASLAGYGAQLTLLDHMGGYSPGLRASRV